VIVDAGGGQVDHHHAGLAVALEVVGVFQARRADARREAEIGVVGEVERLVVVLGAGDRGDRPKDLLAGDAHAVVDVREQGRRQVEAGAVALQELAAGGEGGALVLADLDVGEVLVELVLVDHGADMRALLEGVVDDESAHALGHGLDEAVVDAARDDDA
jgi:hypothetical protein